MCTGTAVTPNVVLTAGHCVANANYFFTFQSQTATPQRFDVRGRWASPTRDIGLLWLWQPVPATRPIKQNVPANSVAAVYGFGGNNCEPNAAGQWTLNDGILVKRITWFTTTGTSNLINAPLICGGDSGGPVIDWNDGIIFGVISTSSGSQPGDIGTFTPTSTQWPELNFVIYVWQATSNQGG
jgi:V8-like Glu-specific endopeptidase